MWYFLCHRMYYFILILCNIYLLPWNESVRQNHSRMEPYLCNYCEYNFSNNSDLVIHLSTHNGDNLYQCSQCDIGFTQNSYMESHIRTHTKENLYKCSHCEKGFQVKTNSSFEYTHWRVALYMHSLQQVFLTEFYFK